VFFAPSAPGLKREDFVTNINPTLRVNHAGEYATGSLEVGGFGETYVNNPGLNYIGTADTLRLNLDNSVKRLLPNASLRISDYVRYTPTPPGFANPIAGTSPSSPVNLQNVYAQGILSYRSNNLINNADVSTSYDTTATTSLNASYSHAIIRFGSSPVASTAPLLLFDTTTQTGTVGGKAQVSALDTLNVRYAHAQSEFIPHTTSASSTSARSSFKTDTVTLGWSRTLTPYLTAEAGGGGILIDPGITTYSANASLVMNLPNHVATLSYARSAFPSFIGAGVIVTSDSVSLTAIQKIARQWQLAESANYAHSSGASGAASIKFTTYSATADVYYWVTRIWSTALSFDYLNINQEFGTGKANFDRYAVTFSLRATWD
jgi:hypothetical protein